MDFFFNNSVTKLKKEKKITLWFRMIKDVLFQYFSSQVNFRIKTSSQNNVLKQFILKLSKQNIEEISRNFSILHFSPFIHLI